jgi:hypothetical protein
VLIFARMNGWERGGGTFVTNPGGVVC